MKERSGVRHESSRLPDELVGVYLVLNDGSQIKATVVNICTHGMAVEILPSGHQQMIPEKNETVKVIFSSEHGGYSGLCVYSESRADGRSRLGIYFYYPNEQNALHILLKGLSLPDPDQDSDSGGISIFDDRKFIKHEWEERVRMLCNSDDPKLRSIGKQEMEVLNQKTPCPPKNEVN